MLAEDARDSTRGWSWSNVAEAATKGWHDPVGRGGRRRTCSSGPGRRQQGCESSGSPLVVAADGVQKSSGSRARLPWCGSAAVRARGRAPGARRRRHGGRGARQGKRRRRGRRSSLMWRRAAARRREQGHSICGVAPGRGRAMARRAGGGRWRAGEGEREDAAARGVDGDGRCRRRAEVHGAATVAGGEDAGSRQRRPAGQEQSSNRGGTCASMKSSSSERLQERA